MIKVENIDVCGFEHALRGMRNPMNSWDKSDSHMELVLRHDEEHAKVECVMGENDLDLAQRLFKAGVEHRTYLRMIQLSMDITAPLYWWKEMDRYTVGKTQVSCSTMHKIHSKEFELDDFSHEHLLHTGEGDNPIDMILYWLNYYRERYLETKSKDYWWQLIQLLPTSYNQRRTICMSYETVFKIIKERTGHKLDEWCEFCEILKDLPYVREIGGMYEDITE